MFLTKLCCAKKNFVLSRRNFNDQERRVDRLSPSGRTNSSAFLFQLSVFFYLVAFSADPALAQVPPSASNAANFSTTAPAPVADAPSSQRSKPKLSLGVSATSRRLEDELVKSNVSGPTLELRGEHKFNSFIEGKLITGGLLLSGAASSLYSTEGQPGSVFYISEANLALRPFQPLSIRGGIVESRFNSNPSLLRPPNGFPGLQQVLSFDRNWWQISLSAMQAVPTATGVSKAYVDEGQYPELYTASVGLGLGKAQDLLSANFAWNQFEFVNLPANAAHDSRFAGNQVIGLGAMAAQYLYGFAGSEVSAVLRSQPTRWLKLETRGSALKNDRAPKGVNQGVSAGASATITYRGVEVTPEWGYFRNEADTLPATYTSSGTAFVNRIGWHGGMRVKLVEENLSLTARYVEANRLNSNLLTSQYVADRQIFTIALETSYDLL